MADDKAMRNPKYPSCKNMGLAVREFKKGTYLDRDPEQSQNGIVSGIIVFGVSLGVGSSPHAPHFAHFI